jgi:hypothetical protein
MTLAEIRDLFVAQYKIQSQVRGIREIEIDNKILASFISQGQQDIQRRLLVSEAYADLTLTANEADLPGDFGLHKLAYIGDTLLTQKDSNFVRKQISRGNTGDWFAIYQAGNTQKILTTYSTGTLRIYYYPDFLYYRPLLGSVQGWGTFSGIAFSGKLMIPDRYDMAVIYYMLSQVIPDYYNIYEKEIRSLKSSRVSSMDDAFGYDLGGIGGDIITGATGTSSTPAAAVTPAADAPDKKSRFRVTDAGIATEEYADGWSTDPTIVNNVSSIVITSADSEFINFIHIRVNNQDFGYTMTSSEITITPYPLAGWGEVEIILEVWNS